MIVLEICNWYDQPGQMWSAQIIMHQISYYAEDLLDQLETSAEADLLANVMDLGAKCGQVKIISSQLYKPMQ